MHVNSVKIRIQPKKGNRLLLAKFLNSAPWEMARCRIDVWAARKLSLLHKSESSFGRVNVWKLAHVSCQHIVDELSTNPHRKLPNVLKLFVISSDKSFDSRFVYILSHTLVHSLQFSISLIIVSCISCRLYPLCLTVSYWCVVSLTRTFCFLVCFFRQCLICFAGYYCKTYI